MKRIAVCGEAYSANLGDQAIHACLLHLLKRIDPDLDPISLDISGRNGSPSAQAQPGFRKSIGDWQAKPVLKPIYLLVNAVYQSYRLKRMYAGPWGQTLAAAQALVIGGGQLLMDDGLNFPFKVAGAAEQARRLDIPYHFSACGVGRSWSAAGRMLFEGALRGAQSITLRDQLSAQRLRKMQPELHPKITFDPAIWAADVYPVGHKTNAAGAIGLGVMNNGEFNARATYNRFSQAEWLQLWLDLVDALRQNNTPVVLFTTGSSADQQFANALHAQAGLRGWLGIELAPRPDSVPALAQILAQCDLVVAARLHAAILANAYQIDTIGLTWDEKVRAYYTETGRPEQCFDLSADSIVEIVRSTRALNRHPFPAAAVEELRERALENARIIFRGEVRDE